ncbi:3'-5' exonuclease [Fusobacterium sp.]|uniref:3'-5' exonuclease n=1 Tax=Fusobacterium sp. TaxID=68766 RepID=UPI002610EC83|nr:3'-5' exonuclease [Fusobacterium sp.]
MDSKIIPIIVFDTETNGLTVDCSVLSISAIKVFYDLNKNMFLKEFETYDRYYYVKDGEEENQDAISVNGLTKEEITKRRNDCSYPKFFYEDIESFKIFCNKTKHFIGHNIKFDLKYIEGYIDVPYTFDTMTTNKNILKIESFYGYKNPRLSETADFYNIDVSCYSFHSSLDDVKVTAKIFRKMCKNSDKNAMKFLNLK